MQLSNVLCCIFLTVTVSVTCGETDVLQTSNDIQAQNEKKISKRNAIPADDYPIYVQRQHAKNQKKKSQTKKIVPLKAKYGSRLKHKPFQAKPSNTQHKKSRYQKNHPSIPMPATYKYSKQNTKSRHRSPYKLIPKPKYEMPKYGIPSYESSGFGEPPHDYKHMQGENKITRTPDNKQEYGPWYRYTKQDYSFINQKLNSKSHEDPKGNIYRPKYFTDNSKVIKQYSKAYKNSEHKLIVGGKYAEPPPRYAPLPKYQKKEPLQGFKKSINVSPYVNYKNSNMAFSPQNLNDAFSVDK